MNRVKNICFWENGEKKEVRLEDFFEITSKGLYYPIQMGNDVVQGFISKQKVKEIIKAFN